MAKKKNDNDTTEIVKPESPCVEQHITDTLEENYMPYAMSVIVSRAIPEIDGMKPSHRKLLYTMYKMGLLSGGKTILSSEPLYSYEKKLTLEDGFFKCSRSFIVNIHRIDTFTAKEIRTRSGARIPISRSCHREFENAYFSVLFGKERDTL